MFGARKQGVIRQRLEIVFSLFYFYLHPNISLKQQKKNQLFCPFAKVYAREMQKFREFFGSRKFLLLKYYLLISVER